MRPTPAQQLTAAHLAYDARLPEPCDDAPDTIDDCEPSPYDGCEPEFAYTDEVWP